MSGDVIYGPNGERMRVTPASVDLSQNFAAVAQRELKKGPTAEQVAAALAVRRRRRRLGQNGFGHGKSMAVPK
jgi:hypothetical protein